MGTFLEVVLPVLFAGLLLLIKNLADDSSSFLRQEVPEKYSNHYDTRQILSFSDYVTAIVAQRICLARQSGGDPDTEYDISGLPQESYDWQVPFVKCDSRRCQYDGEEAYKYCVYPILALAPSTEDDQVGLERMTQFKNYTLTRFPQLQDESLTHFPNETHFSNGYDFVQTFPSSNAIDNYIKDKAYGNTGNEQIGLAVVFTGNDNDDDDNPIDFSYTIRANSTNFNAPEEEARPGVSTSPDTKRIFSSFAKTDDVCTPLGGAPDQGSLQNSWYVVVAYCSSTLCLIYCILW